MLYRLIVPNEVSMSTVDIIISDHLSLWWNGKQKLLLRNCCETCLKVILRVLLPAFKPVLQQIRLLQVAWKRASDWLKLRGSHDSFYAGKTRIMYRFCWTALYYSLCDNFSQPSTTWFAWHVWFVGVKRAILLFNSFCSNVAQQATRFFCLFLPLVFLLLLQASRTHLKE